MKKSELRDVIKEEIKNYINEAESKNFDKEFKKFIDYITKRYDDYYKKDSPELHKKGMTSTILVTKGGRFMKVWAASKQGKKQHIHAFVERETGDIYKPAGVNAAAKGARGSIFDFNSYKNADVYGGWLYKR